MFRRYLFIALAFALGCASGRRTPVPQTSTAAAMDCGARYAVTVRNEGTATTASVYYSDAKLIKPAASLGSVAPKDERTFFFRMEEQPVVWAQVGSVRIYPNNRTTEQRFRVYVTLACDAG